MDSLRFKRFLSLALAFLMVLSNVPVQVFANETGSECTHQIHVVNSTATCTEAGVTTTTCGTCGMVLETMETGATGHSFADGVCTVEGCGEKDPSYAPSETEHQHTWGDVYGSTATCEAAGVGYQDCTAEDCSEKREVTVAATGHNYVDGKCACGAEEALVVPETTAPTKTEPEVDELVVKVQAMIDALPELPSVVTQAQLDAYQAEVAKITPYLETMTEEQTAQLVGLQEKLNPVVTIQSEGLLGTGTAEDPYQIGSVEDFKLFAKETQGGNSFGSKFIALTADIDFEGANYLEIAEDGTVVTDYRIPKFSGTFDGNGHTIKNFNFVVKNSGKHNIMMFSQDSMWAYIKNLKIENVTVNVADISGETRITALANRVNAGGMTDAAIKNVHVKNFKIVSNNTTSDKLRIGGLAYFVQGSQLVIKDSSITNFEVDVNSVELLGGAVAVVKSKCDFENVDVVDAVFAVDEISNSGVIGGFVGQTQDQGTGTTFTDCDVTGIKMSLGDIANNIGGFVASIGSVSQFYSCTVTGSINATNASSIGGFAGDLGWNGMFAPNVQHEFNDCVADVDITAENGNVGGFIGDSTVAGYPKRFMPAYFNDCEAKGDVKTENGAAGGFVGRGDRGIFNNCSASGDVTGRIAGGFWGEIYPKAEAESTGGWSYQNKVVTHEDTNSKTIVLENLEATGKVTGTDYEAQLVGFMKDIYVNADSTLGYVTPVILNGNQTSEYNRYEYPEDAVAPVVYAAKIGETAYESLSAAVAAANAGDTITVIADIADEAVKVDKSLTITGSVAANNVSINAEEGCAELTVSGLTFTGNSWINSGAAGKLTVSGVTANVTPSNATYTNSRSAFISLGRDEAKELELIVENSKIAPKSGTNPILGWAAITKAAITGNTFGSETVYQNSGDSVKFLNIADGAVFNISGNIIYSNYNGIVFSQNNTRGNAYTATIENNKFYGEADHIWIEVPGYNTCNGTVLAKTDNTINGNTFTVTDIKLHPELKTFNGALGVDAEMDAEGKLTSGTFAKRPAADLIAEGYEVKADGNSYYTIVEKVVVAKIGDQKFNSLQDAVNAVKDGETIMLQADITENVTLTEKVGLTYTIDGNGKTMNGTIAITPLSDTEDNRRITIKNINFVNTADASTDFISSVATNHYPRITVEACSFTGNGKGTDVAVRLKSSHSVIIKDCTGTGLHSFLQNTSGWNLTVENVTVIDSKSGLALGTVQGVTVKDCDITVDGYGIRMDAQYNNAAVIESNNVNAFIPVVVRKAEVDSSITFNGKNTMTATNTDGIWCAIGTTEYEKNGELPTDDDDTTVTVTVNDAGLNQAGIYNVLGAGTWGGIDWMLSKDGVLTIAPTKGTPVADTNSGKTYEVGAWREAVRYDSKGNGVAIEGWPYDRAKVKTLIIEEGVTSIGSFAAQGFTNLTGEVVIPSTVTYIGQEAFQKSTMTKLTFAAGGSEELCIAQGAFKNLIIEEVALPGDRPVHLHAWVFNNCHNLKTAYIPASVVSVHGTNHIDYNKDFNAHSNPTWTKSSEIFAYNENMETVVFENEEVLDMFYANNNGTSKDYLVANVGTTSYTSLQAAINAAENGETVKLIKNITLSDAITIPAGKTVTLELNGKTISQTKAQTAGYQMILNDGNLTITDSSDKGTGKISYTDSGNGGEYISDTIYNRGTLVINGGTIENLSSATVASNGYPHAVDTYSGIRDTSVTINGGTIICDNYSAIRMFCVSATNKADLTINAGTIKGAVDMQNGTKDAALGSLTVNGGTFETTANEYNIRFANWNGGATEYGITAEINGGSFNGTFSTAYVPEAANWDKKIVTGGAYKSGDVEAFLAEGCSLKYNSGWFYVETNPVATVAGTDYTTLQAAIEAAKDGETVYLKKNITLKGTVTVPEGANVTLDLKGKTLTGAILAPNATLAVKNGSIVNKDKTVSAIEINAGKLTLTNVNVDSARHALRIDGDVEAIIDGGKYTLNATSGTRHAVNVSGAANVTIKNGTFVGPKGTTMDSGSALCVQKDATVTIEGGSFSGGKKDTLGVNAAGTLSIVGGTFDQDPSAYVADGFKAMKNADGTYNIVKMLKGKGTAANPFKITNAEELIMFRDSVNAGDTEYNAPGVYVALTADIDMAGATWERGIGDGINATFDGIFDGNNKTIKNLNLAPKADSDKYFCGGLFGYTYGAAVIKNVVLENITVTAEGEGHNVGALVGFANNNGGKLTVSNVTVKNVTIDAPNAYGVGAIVGYSYRAMGTIENCSVDGATITGYSFVGGITGYSYNDAQITGCSVKDATITATSYSAGGIAGLANPGNKISGCTVENVTVSGQANTGSVIGALGGDSAVVENCTAAEPMVGGRYADNEKVEAKIGNTYYATFEKAYAAAEAGETIVLLDALTLAETKVIEKSIGIELNGNTVTGTFELVEGIELTGPESLKVVTKVADSKVAYENGVHKIIAKTYTVKIGETKYETLAEAIGVAKAGDEIVLIDNVTENVTVKKDLTINGAYNNYTGNIAVNGSTVDATIKNVNFVNGTNYAVTTNTINSVTIEDCTVENYGTGFLYANRSTNTITVKNVTVDGGNYGMHWVYGNSATLENVVMTNVANGLYIQNHANKTVTLNNCNITSIQIWERDGKSGVQTFKFKGENTVGTLSDSQYAKYVLAEATATLNAPEGATVASGVEGYAVFCKAGKYYLAKPVAKIGDEMFETFAEALAAAQDKDTITLNWTEGDAPIAMNGSVFGKSVTITGTATVDWNKGFLFIGRGGEGNGTVIFEGANLTSASNSASYGIHVSGREKNTDNKYDGTLVIKDSTIELDYLIGKNIITLDNSTLTVKNGFSIGGRLADETESGVDATATLNLTNNSKLIVNNHNGMGLGTEGNKVGVGVMDIDATSTFETTQSFLVTDKGTMNIAGTAKIAGTLTNNGSIVLKDVAATLTASECGNVTTDVADYKASYADGAYKLTQKTYVAEIKDGEKFESLQAAIDAAQDGNTVTLMEDIELGWADVTKTADGYAVLTLTDGKSINLDLNGKKIFVNHAAADAERIYAVVHVTDGASLKVTGNGTIDVHTNDETPKVAYMFWKRGTTGTLVIENGTFHMDNAEDSIVYAAASETVIIEGGTFTLDKTGTAANGSPWIFNVKGQNTGHVIVTGGTFNADINHQYWVHEVLIPKEEALKDNGDGTWTIEKAVAYVTEIAEGYKRDVGYVTLAEAIAANGTDVTIIAECELDQVWENNYTITVTDGANFTMAEGASIVLKTETATVKAAEGLTVTTDIADHKVVYADGIYSVVEKNYTVKIGETKYETLTEAIAAANPGDTINFLTNINENVTVNKNVIIDGAKDEENNYTYTGEMTMSKVDVTIENVDFVKGNINKVKKTAVGGNYTIRNCNFDGDDQLNYAVNLHNTANIVIENVTAKDYLYGFLQVPSTNTSISVKGVEVRDVNYGFKIDYSNSVTMEDVIVKNARQYALYDSNHGTKTYTIKNSTLNSIEIWERDGKTGIATFNFEGNNIVDVLENSEFAKYVLTDTDQIPTNAVLITDKDENLTISTDVPDYKVVYETYAYKLVAKDYVAQIGDGETAQKFESLAEAFDKAQSGDTITMIADHVMDGSKPVNDNTWVYDNLIVNGKDITLDFAGYTVEVTPNFTATDDGGLKGTLEAIIFLENNASLTMLDETGKGGFNVKAGTDLYSLIYNSSSTLKILSGNYYVEKLVTAGSLIYADGEQTTTIEGGVFTLGNAGQDTNSTKPWLFNVEGKNDDFIQISGGYFNQNPHLNLNTVKDCEVEIAEGAFFQQINSGEYEGYWTLAYAVAQYEKTGAYFATVEDALTAAKAEGGKVIVLRDVVANDSVIMVPAGVTLDLNGKYLTAENMIAFGSVIDDGEPAGGLVISNDTTEAMVSLQQNNPYLPIYDTNYKNDDGAVGCYRFFEYTVKTMGYKAISNNTDAIELHTRISFEDEDAYNLLATTEEPGFEFIVNISWGETETPIRYTYRPETVKSYAAQAYNQLLTANKMTKTLKAGLAGLDMLDSGIVIEFNAELISVTRVGMNGAEKTYTAQ